MTTPSHLPVDTPFSKGDLLETKKVKKSPLTKGVPTRVGEGCFFIFLCSQIRGLFS